MAEVATEIRSRTLVVTIERPEVRNAVDGPTARALTDAFESFDADPGVDVAILQGAGGTFCAGADLKAIAADPERANPVTPEGIGPMGPTRLRLGKPVIAAIEGHAVAGGFELALWCDLRVAAHGATFGFFNRRWGVPLVDGGTVRLPRIVGEGRALDLILTGRPVAADEALAMGLVTRVVDDGGALDAALELAGELGALPQPGLRSDRRSVLEGAGRPHDDAMRAEFGLAWEIIRSGDAQSGARRFAGNDEEEMA